MTHVANFGDPLSPIWIIVDEPYSSDEEKAIIYSGGHGYNFRKVWSMAGLPDPYIYCLRPVLGATYDNSTVFCRLLNDLGSNSTPFILPTSPATFKEFCPELVSKSQEKAILKKYAGNLLESRFVSHKHFIIPQYPPDFVGANWDYSEIQAFIDYGHVREEYEYYKSWGIVQPLPTRTLVIEPTYSELISHLLRIKYDFSCGVFSHISVDIETIRPRQKTYYSKLYHPGYPYTIALATSPFWGISFSLWDYPADESYKIWRLLGEILSTIPNLGQNYFSFDTHFLEALGFTIDLNRVQDTLIRHHILWPGLEHKLQFQTKQYTRQPFYKDEGKNWNPKYKAQLLRYNALDVVITYEIYLAQELEFGSRPHLKG